MKTILVLTGGSETDDVVFDTALAAAEPISAHLEFLHVRVSPGEAAQFTPHVDFTSGAALRSAMDRLRADEATRSANAASHFERFCQEQDITIMDAPVPCDGVSATWHEERDDASQRILILKHGRW